MMRDRDNTDVWAAVAVGAIVGIGAALMIRARQEDDTHELLRKLRPVRKRVQRGAADAAKVVRRTARSAGEAGGEFVGASRDVLEDLRSGASEIIRDTRRELQKAARQSVKEARSAARRATRDVLR